MLVDQKVMIGDMFRSGIEQDFETAYIQISNADGDALPKELFIKSEMLHCLKAMIENCVSTIGSSSEMSERQAIV
eukprot:gene37996-49804_t